MLCTVVSCIAPHVILGPTDYPQVRQGGKVKFQSLDGNIFQIQFTDPTKSPCRPDTPHATPSAKATCTVVGKPGVYQYNISPKKISAQTTGTAVPRLLNVVPSVFLCTGCGSWKGNQQKGDQNKKKSGHGTMAANPAAAKVDAYIVVDSSNKPTVYETCDPTLTYPCALSNDAVVWQANGGDGDTLTISFDDSTGSPCNGTLSTTSPVTCTINPNQTPGDYNYKINGSGTTYKLTVKAP